MDEQTTLRASVAICSSAAVVYLEGTDCPHCATAINRFYRVVAPCRDPHRHAVETALNWRKMGSSAPDDYRVVDLVIVDQGDTTTNITAARISALRTPQGEE